MLVASSLETGEVCWWIGHETDRLRRVANGDEVTVQADGDELAWIYHSFSNIPTPTEARVVRWHGDMARFILNNLRKE